MKKKKEKYVSQKYEYWLCISCQLYSKTSDVGIRREKPHVKAWFRPCDWLQYFIHEMSESLWRIMLFKLFTQRKEIERKLGELHETETLGLRGSRKWERE